MSGAARRYGVRSALVVAIALLSSVAHAEPSPADRETARGLMDAGDRAAANNDLDAALEAYRGADAILHAPTTALEVAKTKERLGLLLGAHDAALAIGRVPQQANEPAAFAAARKAAAELAENVGPRIPSIEVSLTGLRPNVRASLSVDGEVVPLEATTLPRPVDPGTHTIVVKAPGYLAATKEVVVAEKEHLAVEVHMDPAPAAAVAATSPRVGEETAPPSAHSSRTLTYGLLGVGGAGLVVGAVTGALSLSEKSSAHCSGANVCPASSQGDISTAKSLAWASDVGFGVGIAGVAAAAVLFFTERHETKQPPATSIRFVGGPTASGASVGLAGSF